MATPIDIPICILQCIGCTQIPIEGTTMCKFCHDRFSSFADFTGPQSVYNKVAGSNVQYYYCQTTAFLPKGGLHNPPKEVAKGPVAKTRKRRLSE